MALTVVSWLDTRSKCGLSWIKFQNILTYCKSTLSQGLKDRNYFRDTFHYADSSSDGIKAIGRKLLLHWQDKERSPDSVSHRRRVHCHPLTIERRMSVVFTNILMKQQKINYLTLQPSNTHPLNIFEMKWELHTKPLCCTLKCVRRLEKEHLCDWAESWTSQFFSSWTTILDLKKTTDRQPMCLFLTFLYHFNENNWQHLLLENLDLPL